ncbi:MAG: NADP-dependent malic enzyme, partial [Gammaproteobacteria bacterium]|nr:NADP-dependent malic enzyme [Gammaproteobacteria bacterium]
IELGLRREHILVVDRAGVIYNGRNEGMYRYKSRFAADTESRTLQQALVGADLFLGLSAAGLLQPEWLVPMAEKPLIFALANPIPEILPDEVSQVRADAIFASGRSDFPNQINNVLCFPFLFRGALDCGATEINGAMKRACVEAIAKMAQARPSEIVRSAYGGLDLKFGPDYLIPKPFDPRLMEHIAPAVAEAAMRSGVASRPIDDLEGYRQSMQNRVYQTGMTMKPVFNQARRAPQRVAFAEGEEERVLQAAQQALEQGIARPLLIGRRIVIEEKLNRLGLGIRVDSDLELLDPHDNPDYEAHVDLFYGRTKRRGYALEEAATEIRDNPTALAATLLHSGKVDAMVCGAVGRYQRHLEQIDLLIGTVQGVERFSAMEAVVMQSGTLFISDTSVQSSPSAEALEEITRLSVDEVRRFGVEPKVAMVSHSNFGGYEDEDATKMHQALRLIRRNQPELEIEGEMRADLALSESMRSHRFPDSLLEGRANLLIMPSRGAASISSSLVKMVGEGIIIGPLLLGAAKSAHIATPET